MAKGRVMLPWPEVDIKCQSLSYNNLVSLQLRLCRSAWQKSSQEEPQKHALVQMGHRSCTLDMLQASLLGLEL